MHGRGRDWRDRTPLPLPGGRWQMLNLCVEQFGGDTTQSTHKDLISD